MPSPAQCVLTGEVYNILGTGLAEVGTKIYIKRVQLDGYALASKRVDFVVNTDGELVTTDGEPASLPQGATVTLQGSVEGFQNETRVVIPEEDEYEFRLLVPGAPPSSTSVSQAAFNAHTSKLANPDDAGHIVGVAGGLTLEDGVITGTPVSQETVQDYLSTFFNSTTPALTADYNDASNRVDLAIANAGAQAGLMSAADKTKLDGVATNATANSSDASLLARANHTGTQSAATISDFNAAADARVSAAVGVSVQGLDATLTSLAALGTAGDRIPYTTGVDSWAETPLTAFSRTLLDDADAGAARATLGAGDVAGPASSVDNALSRYDGATGKLLQTSPLSITDAGLLQFGTGVNDMALKAVSGSAVVAVRNAADSAYRGIAVAGAQLYGSDFNLWDSAGSNRYAIWGSSVSNHLRVASGVYVGWTSNAGDAYNGGVSDTAIGRGAAGVVQASDGGANANGTFKASRFNLSTTVTPSGSADAQGATGDVRYDDSYVYVKTSAGWKRAALATF